ncbi:uncharacterized protein MKK02DRAFT_39888 [Dioszegia hungarica]|uniref:Uncharacterized protein n=1 Tax=Dioszegia hungarica TaxID=4972 RepID=A0AA38HE32_9TREE|nr:uncharacterized protein MKK02DRAFT_39888 [Dioszegia hungarica]KAI9639572.1 hypothetical protein MKK02DRAFT_39888 [Dioszegia hungarica]
MSDVHDTDVPECPNGVFNFPSGSTRVVDADEEIMELYMTLSTITSTSEDLGESTGGLGYLDATQSILQLDLELVPPMKGAVPKAAKGRSRRTNGAATSREEAMVVSVQLQQDLHTLKTSKGDTGSVLWRSSLHLARHILTQHTFPTPSVIPLLSPDKLKSARILELGSGTGLLGVLLSPLCSSYVASDRFENLRLIQRNIELNGLGDSKSGQSGRAGASKAARGAVTAAESALEVREVDWVEASGARRKREASGKVAQDSESDGEEPFDLILAVDCIFNESLVQPLVDTFARYCSEGGRTMVWVVIELRSSDVLTLFMDTWLNDPAGPWTIIRLSEEAMGMWDGGAKGASADKSLNGDAAVRPLVCVWIHDGSAMSDGTGWELGGGDGLFLEQFAIMGAEVSTAGAWVAQGGGAQEAIVLLLEWLGDEHESFHDPYTLDMSQEPPNIMQSGNSPPQEFTDNDLIPPFNLIRESLPIITGSIHLHWLGSTYPPLPSHTSPTTTSAPSHPTITLHSAPPHYLPGFPGPVHMIPGAVDRVDFGSDDLYALHYPTGGETSRIALWSIFLRALGIHVTDLGSTFADSAQAEVDQALADFAATLPMERLPFPTPAEKGVVGEADLDIFRTVSTPSRHADLHSDSAIIFSGPGIGNLHRTYPPSPREMLWLLRYLQDRGFTCQLEANFGPLSHDVILPLGASPFPSDFTPHGFEKPRRWSGVNSSEWGTRQPTVQRK